MNYCFFDDGWSGASFDRPGFMEMMDCVERYEVKCVLTKNLSCMGRNYLQVGMFTEIIFLKEGVRFILKKESFGELRIDTEHRQQDR